MGDVNDFLNKIINGDCMELLPNLPDKSIDAIICDLPYGTVECSWDSIIPIVPLWEQYRRIAKDDAAIVLFSAQPFSSKLVSAAYDLFKYEWVWVKNKPTGFQTVKTQPMRLHENILVFSKGTVANGSKRLMKYYPQGLIPIDKETKISGNKRGKYLGNRPNQEGIVVKSQFTNYPKSLLQFDKEPKYVHPTQKPIKLVEYLVNTYTKPGDIILDNACGSGTLAVAAINTERQFICFEKEPEYFDISVSRMREAWKTKQI